MRLIFLGPPGAGKGTQAALLLQRYGTVALASGNILREALRRGDPIVWTVRPDAPILLPADQD